MIDSRDFRENFLIGMAEEKLSERADRLKKLVKIKERGLTAYPAKSSRSILTAKVLENFVSLANQETNLTLAGRLRAWRLHGSIAFADLEDASGRLQLVINKQAMGEVAYKNFVDLIDSSDFIQVSGTCFVTKAGQPSLLVKSWQLLSKALRPLPDAWFGLKDEEERLRRRYLDILLNPEIKKLILQKEKFWQSVREFLKQRGFIEVETPVLENMPGGADARPFITHHNTLDLDVYLRISMGELWQKQLMVAGLEKTFEIGRQFRNEGMDAEHLQDYTQVEFYWAYADYRQGMQLVEELYKYVAQETFGTCQFTIGQWQVDLQKPWAVYDFSAIILERTGIDVQRASLPEIEKKLQELQISYDQQGFNLTRAIDNLWKYCRKTLAGPGFLTGVPLVVSPLAKADPERPALAQRFQVIIAGSELGNGYSELNDPLEQAKRFLEQQNLREQGDEEAQNYDADFVEALEYGMPPTCGFGMSERVFSFLSNKTARECQIFPLLKPKEIKSRIMTAEPILEPQSESVLGLDYQQAKDLANQYLQSANTKKHCRATEAIMRALAQHLGQNENHWGIVGLLHDLDWDLTKDDQAQHGVKTVEILKNTGASQFLINAVVSHCYGNAVCPAYVALKRNSVLEHALAAAENLTGLIAACALVQPDKKLSKVELRSLQKKFDTPSFAANCDRKIIQECELAGLRLEEFLQISLDAMKSVAEELEL